MSSLEIPSVMPELGVGATPSSPVIIATDGLAQSDSALVVGRLLAEGPHALRLVTVLKPVSPIPDAPISVTAEIDEARRESARSRAISQMVRVWDDHCALELYEGDPATVVARIAKQANATMIVAGLGRHSVSDRIFGDETALRLIRIATVPVLAAAVGFHHPVRRIVVAMDFSETSVRAARLALGVAAPGATVYLAHVAPREGSLHDAGDWSTTYKREADADLLKVRDQLNVPPGMLVQTVLLQGDPATQVLALASRVNADLIATGSHGHGFVARTVVGSVTTRIVRCALCSVLTVPCA